MKTQEIIDQLRQKNIELSVVDGTLRVRGDKQVLHESGLLALLQEHKPALIAAIQEGGKIGSADGLLQLAPNLIAPGCTALTPAMLPLIDLSQENIDQICTSVTGGAANIQDIYPLVALQEGILFHHVLESQGDVYLLGTLYEVDTRARLALYADALQAVIDRHDVLRTGFAWENLSEPAQVVWRAAKLITEEVCFDPADGDIAMQLRKRFDPRHYRLDVRQAPLIRLFITEDVPNGRWLMLLLSHHLIADHTTLEIVDEEIASHLRSQQQALLAPVPFRNFVVQARLGVSRQEHEAFFSALLADVDETTTPYGLTDVQADGTNIVEQQFTVDADVCQRLRSRSRIEGVSSASLCHLAWAMVLAKTAGRDDVVFGTLMFGRMQGGEGIDRAMGMFINTLPIRIRIDATTVVVAVRQTHDLLTRMLRHEHAPLALAQRCSGIRAPAPLFTAMLNYRHNSAAMDHQADAEAAKAWQGIKPIWGEERSNYPFGISINDEAQGLSFDVHVDQSIDPLQVCELMQTALVSLLTALEHAPATPLRELAVLPVARQHALLALGDGGPSLSGATGTQTDLFGLVARQAAMTPDAIALIESGQELNYRQLVQRANAVAQQLHRLGAGPESRVAILTDRSIDAIVGVLGILAAGAAYVPVDPSYPDERLAYVLNNAGALALVVPPALTSRAVTALRLRPALDGKLVIIDPQQACDSGPSDSAPAPDHAAYVIYTSGSTGTPKGVVVEQRHALNLVHGFIARHDFANQRLLMIPPLVFDASVGDLFPVLAVGSTLVLHAAPTELGCNELEQFCRTYRVSAIDAPAVLWRRWTDDFLAQANPEPVLPDLRLMMFGGESVPLEQVHRFARLTENRVIMSNHYGPTEASVCATILSTRDGAHLQGLELPIGTPLPGVRVYVLDAALGLVPEGATGELCIGGQGVTRGYLDAPELTAESFVRDPFSSADQARMYRTGDLVRWNRDATLQFLGRRDQQVKIRGFRIELAEIEAALLNYPAVREAVVSVRGTQGGAPGADKQLVAYLTLGGLDTNAATSAASRAESPIALDALRAHLSATLPPYMIPVAFVVMAELPLTTNGKLDRKALPAPGLDAFITREYEAPASVAEIALAKIWTEVLQLERVSRHDNFFDLGGNSLLAVTLVSRLRQRLGIETPLKEIFARAQLKELALLLDVASAQPALAPLPLLQPLPRDPALPLHLSFAQQRLWILAQMEGVSQAYHMPLALRLRGTLDQAALQQALDRIVFRHEALRTVFARGDTDPVQIIGPAGCGFALAKHDLSQHPEREIELAHRAAAEAIHPFDLSCGPLIRGQLLRLSDQEQVLLITMHHIVSDGWSMAIFTNELNLLYRAFHDGRADPLPPLSIQYADYAHWQRQWLSGTVLQQQSAYWHQTLRGAPLLLTLPTDRPRPHEQSLVGAAVALHLDEGLTRDLKALARQHGVTLYMTVLAAWAIVLSRLAGQDEVVIGTPVANRTRAEIENQIGFFVNTLALRIDVAGRSSSADLLQQVKTRTLDAQEHQALPFEQVVDLLKPPRNLSHTPVFQVMFTWENSVAALDLPQLAVTEEPMAYHQVKFDLELALTEEHDRISGRLSYATALFDAATISRHAGYLQQALRALVQDQSRPPLEIDLLPAAERRQLLQTFNQTETDPGHDRLPHQLFEAQAAARPAALAVASSDGEHFSYAALNAKANQLAHFLRAREVTHDSKVVVCMARSIDMVIAFLAILKAGGAYVPVDPTYPSQRISYMLQDSGARVVLGHDSTWSMLSDLSQQIGTTTAVCNLSDPALLAAYPDSNPVPLVRDDTRLVYIIYTSGSTGKPKAAQLELRGFSNLLDWYVQDLNLAADDVMLLLTSHSFDLTQKNIFGPLTTGGQLHLAAEPFDPRAILAQIGAAGVTQINLTPSAFHALIDVDQQHQLSGLRRVVLGGEPIVPARLAALPVPRPQFINSYGPTECSDVVSYYRLDADLARYRNRSVPLGQPVRNMQLYILDQRREPVPIGASGEIYIGGIGVGRGYLYQPELTAAVFCDDPFSQTPGARLYKTGDLGRYLFDGSIEYLGRNDFQVKIRGFRIELGEIETRLMACGDVSDCAVLARADEDGSQRLIAYVAAKAGHALTPAALRQTLAQQLADYMIPSAFVLMATLPLTPNGKLDRQALPDPGAAAFVSSAYEAPVGEVEITLARIWGEILKKEQISRHDNFFDLGGHSLLAVRMVTRIEQTWGIAFSLRAVFEAPVLQQMEQRILSESAQSHADADQLEALLASLENLSDEEALAQLQETDRLLADDGGSRINA